MIYISAQPDDFFFTWQIEIQILNFSSLGITKEDYHILIGVEPQIGISKEFMGIIEKYSSFASFFIYEDTRKNRSYVPSLRPHIIKKHFDRYPELAEQVIFYHDSDILLKECPFTDAMLSDDTVYLSDTKGYLGSQYVTSTVGISGLSKICTICGITTQDAVNNDDNCGGAQYLLKNVDSSFWSKIETRCNRIYRKLSQLNEQNTQHQIQAWCADMWAMFYTLIEEGRRIKTSDALRFCWSASPIALWDEYAILHYTGDQEQGCSIFRKNLYKDYSPINDYSLKNVSIHTCGIKVVEYIERLRKSRMRYKLEHTVLIVEIPLEVDVLNFNFGFIGYLDSQFSVEFLLISEHKNSYEQSFLNYSNVFSVIHPKEKFEKIAEYKRSGIKHVVNIEYNVLVDSATIYNTILYHYKTLDTISLPIRRYYLVDKLMKKMFEKIQDVELLHCNKSKFFCSKDVCAKAVECVLIQTVLNKDQTKCLSDTQVVLPPSLVGDAFCLI